MLSTQLTLHPHSVYVVMRRILLQNRSDLLTSFHHYKAIPVLCFFFFFKYKFIPVEHESSSGEAPENNFSFAK